MDALRHARAGLIILALAAIACSCATPALAYTDGPFADVYYVNSCAVSGAENSAPAFSATTPPFGFTASNRCPTSGLQITAPRTGSGSTAKWATVTPTPAIRIVGVNAASWADCNLHRDGFTAEWFYGDNGTWYGAPAITVDCHGGTTGEQPSSGLYGFIQPSRYFGLQVSCGPTPCTSQGTSNFVVAATSVRLAAQETTGPAVAAATGNDLYNQTGWVRGTFPANFSASDPSGICTMQTTLNGATASRYSDPSPDTSNWSQCHGSQLPATVDTALYLNGAGAIALSFTAGNAATATSTLSRSINVDNQVPSVSLSGPADAPSTAGTQHVTATASAGPSGLAGVDCSTDGSSPQAYPGATAQVPVAGLGSHVVTCFAVSHSVNASGQPAQSVTETFHLSIRQPTAAAISFTRIANALRCHRAAEVVTVRGRLRMVRRHGRRVLVRGRPRRVHRSVRQCRARTVVRTVRIVARRHGRLVRLRRRERLVLLPHVVDQRARRIRHGRTTTVSGDLALADGTALGGRSVEILAAPDNRLGHFRLLSTVTTTTDGTWTARIPVGPSRLIESVYPGDATTEPVVSLAVRLSVPARIALTISPRALPWSDSITVRGRLLGGYVPPDGVALRFLVRYPGASQRTPLLALRTDRRGRFTFRWSYHAGRGVATYPFTIATTATESDYPFAAASSVPVRVSFGRATRR